MCCFAKESTKEENDGRRKKKDNIKTKQIVPFIFPPFPRLLILLSLKIELKFHYSYNFKSPDDVVSFFLSFSIFYTIVAYLEQGPNKQLNLNYISYSLCAYVILLCFCSSIFVCCVHK